MGEDWFEKPGIFPVAAIMFSDITGIEAVNSPDMAFSGLSNTNGHGIKPSGNLQQALVFIFLPFPPDLSNSRMILGAILKRED